MKLAWLAQTRPDCLYEISQISHISEARFTRKPQEHIKHLNRAVTYAIDKRVSLKVPKIYLDSIRVSGFADAGFASNHDLSSQLGHITFLGRNTDPVVPIHFKPYKAKRATRSPLTAEILAFRHLSDVCIKLSKELNDVYGRHFPVKLFRDSHYVFDNIPKGLRTSEKRMMM